MDRSIAELVRQVEPSLLLRIIQVMSEGILFVDRDGRVIAANEAAKSLRRRYAGKEITEHIYDCHSPAKRDKVRSLLCDLAKNPEKRHLKTIEVGGRYFEISYSAVFSADGEHLGTLAVSRDVTERTAFEKQLSKLATEDHLTGVCNRRRFFEKLEKEVARAKRQGRPLVLALFDVNDFKRINDSLGHQEGDRILVEVAKIASQSVRAGVDTVCRYGGDEFTIILPDATIETARTIAERIKRAASQAIEPKVGISIGLAELAPDMDLDELVRRADQAMYDSKKTHS